MLKHEIGDWLWNKMLAKGNKRVLNENGKDMSPNFDYSVADHRGQRWI